MGQMGEEGKGKGREKGVGRREEEVRYLWPWVHSLILCTHTKSAQSSCLRQLRVILLETV